ncbi:unnamed protein product [Nyctereutes procyonoides]|uniref:(raccoon dog) hypothetical protein n=1 Tax=Nyctereutes procyonoides TaxID=34880 RepID=A0A811ZXB5_NYCPR|nr:unnamed protein product [Nyctereutes procyonoides]
MRYYGNYYGGLGYGCGWRRSSFRRLGYGSGWECGSYPGLGWGCHPLCYGRYGFSSSY